MPEETEKDILKKMHGALVEIRAILALANEDSLSQAKSKLLPQNSLKLQIYNLCDGTKTIQDIANSIQKPEPNVRATLSDLRRDGLIRSSERPDGKQVHEQIF